MVYGDRLELWQATCLWAGREPIYPVPRGKASAYLYRLKSSIAQGDMPIALPPHIAAAINAAQMTTGELRTDLISDKIVVSGAALRAYAALTDERPTFLYDSYDGAKDQQPPDDAATLY